MRMLPACPIARSSRSGLISRRRCNRPLALEYYDNARSHVMKPFHILAVSGEPVLTPNIALLRGSVHAEETSWIGSIENPRKQRRYVADVDLQVVCPRYLLDHEK